MDICLEELHRIDIELDNYTLLGIDSHRQLTVIAWVCKCDEGYSYRIKKYDEHHREIASCEFCKGIRYDVIRLYHNICIFVQLAGCYEKDRYRKNILMVTADGLELKEFPVGKGIRDISISPQGTLWCVYSEQGAYQPYVPTVCKNENSILAAWNFFGELVYALEIPQHEQRQVFKDGYTICAEDNHRVYFITDHLHLYEIEQMQSCRQCKCEIKKPCKMIIRDRQVWITYKKEDRMDQLERYDLLENEAPLIHHMRIIDKQRETLNVHLFMTHKIIWIQHCHFLYRYEI